MEHINLIDTFSEFKELKNIDRVTLIRVLEDAFRSVLVKMFGTDENFDVIINTDKGDFEIWRNREVVADGEVVNENLQIALSQAKLIDEDYEIGEEVTVNFNSDLNEKPENIYSIFYPTVASRVVEKKVELEVPASEDGTHILTLSPLDPGIVFEKIVVDFGGYKPSYLFMNESPSKREL
jgi:hypothetical protein